MRRKQQEIASTSEIENILKKASTCYLGLSENDEPYVVPMSFGYQDNALYLHSALAGKKIEILKKNPRVSFSVVIDNKTILGADACKSIAKYRSVIGTGKAIFLTVAQDKIDALNILMKHQGWDVAARPIDYGNKIGIVLIIKVEIESMTGKFSPLA